MVCCSKVLPQKNQPVVVKVFLDQLLGQGASETNYLGKREKAVVGLFLRLCLSDLRTMRRIYLTDSDHIRTLLRLVGQVNEIW